jgi:hypothetical protein
MKIQDRIKKIAGVNAVYWDSNQNKLTVYYHNLTSNELKIKVAESIGNAGLQRAIDSIALISE